MRSRSASAGVPQRGMVARPLVEERGGDVVVDPRGQVEAIDRPPDGLLAFGIAAGPRGQDHAGPRLQHHQLDELLADAPLLGLGEPREPAGRGSRAGLADRQPIEESPGLHQARGEVTIVRVRPY